MNKVNGALLICKRAAMTELIIVGTALLCCNVAIRPVCLLGSHIGRVSYVCIEKAVITSGAAPLKGRHRVAPADEVLPPPAIAQRQSTARRKKNHGPAILPPTVGVDKPAHDNSSTSRLVENKGTARSIDPAIIIPAPNAPPTTNRTVTPSLEPDPQIAAALASTLATSHAAAQELQSQLEQLQSASDFTRSQLQAQLDELRARKKDEDNVRSDLKGRMKSLDESKRQAESSKRDAERRLKVAKGVKDAIQSRIDAKMAEMAAMRKRMTENEEIIKNSKESRDAREEQLRADMKHKNEEIRAVDAVVLELRLKLTILKERLREEQEKFEAVKASATHQNATAATETSANNSSPGSNSIYPLLFGAGSDELPSLDSTSRDAQWSFPPAAAAAPYSFAYDGKLSLLASQAGHTGDQFVRDYNNFGPSMTTTVPPFDVTSAAAHASNSSQPAFPTVTADVEQDTFARSGPRESQSTGLLRTPTIHAARRTSTYGDTFIPSTPISPFSTDLLPSNLFQNADDDSHPGVLPGSRSEMVEAALGRFGLDNSDTSDAEGGSDRDTVDGCLDAASDHSATDDLDRAKLGKIGSRFWWGKPKMKELELPISQPAVTTPPPSGPSIGHVGQLEEGERADVHGGPTDKRRSFSMFPKLALNPGAKAFKSTMRKQPGLPEAGGVSSDLRTPPSAAGSIDNWSSLSHRQVEAWGRPIAPPASDFEAMRRAFDASTDEDLGRRSWSAFDAWPTSTGPSPLTRRQQFTALEPGQTGSSDSLPVSLTTNTTVPRRAGASWLSEIANLAPLDRSTSAGEVSSSGGSSADSGSRSQTTSRISALWGQAQGQGLGQGQATDGPGTIRLKGPGLHNEQKPSYSYLRPYSSTSTPTPIKAKRPFRWSRRSDSTASSVEIDPRIGNGSGTGEVWAESSGDAGAGHNGQ